MSDTKHGWVSPRADGQRARCGGPGICTTCNTEAMHEKMLTGLFGAPAPHGEQAEREAVDTDSFDDPSALAAAADALSDDTSNDNAQFAAAYLYRQAKALAAAAAAPASPVSTVEQGDALALLDHPLLRDVLGYIEDAGPADVWSAAQAWMALRDAALSAAPAAGDARDVNALMAAEYQQWIDWYHQGRDYDSFLKERLNAAQRQGDA
ncbi:hypothetical protein [Achromobacter ruhlandii]|uniref:hypothetical protein n=1 Tax=Achromobacter ruhlandii TaxID=72557 RepID=UPI0007BF81A9|nr:hypothetical protein [Achromobacter ruhlandii]